MWKGPPPMATATSIPPRADGDHPYPAAVGRVAVGAERRLARNGEMLEVNLVADTAGGLGVPDTVLPARRPKVDVVLHILRPNLQYVVVGEAHSQLATDPFDTHRLEMEKRLRPGEVLHQNLVYADSDRLARSHLAGDEMLLQNFSREVGSHDERPFSVRPNFFFLSSRIP